MPESLLLSPDGCPSGSLCILTVTVTAVLNSIRTQFELQSCQSPSGSVVNALVFHAPDPRIDTRGSDFLCQIFFPGKKSFRHC